MPTTKKLRKFVVAQDALVFRIAARGNNAVQRFMRGAILELDETEDRVKNLVRAKSLIAHDKLDGKPLPRPTAAQVMASFGAVDEVKTPNGKPVENPLPVPPDDVSPPAK